VLIGDPDRIHQCLLNLLGNALKFGPTGTQVTLGLSRNDSRIRIEVSDQGSGLPPGFENKVFEKFQQGVASPVGTGLGLSITRRLVEAMGGVVGVRSRPGEGATFWIEFQALSA
jgi:signal transduction histidine kinase